MPHRYFTTEISDGTATLRGADAHHLARVMRAKPGDTVILCDGNAVEYTATITGFGEDRVDFAVEPGYPSAAEPTVEVTLLAGYTKQDKLEQIIKHGVELGAAHIVPFFSRYCVAAPKKEEQKNERYNRIALEAAKQCGRGVLPDVALPLPNFGAVCRSFDQYDLVLFCYECGGAPLRDLLAAFEREGIHIVLKDFSLGMPLPTVGAVAWDPATFPARSEIVFTAGTAASPAKAAIRAVTEIAQLGGDFCTQACYEASGLSKFERLEDIQWLLKGPVCRLLVRPAGPFLYGKGRRRIADQAASVRSFLSRLRITAPTTLPAARATQ